MAGRKKRTGVDPQGWKAEGESTDQRVTMQGTGGSSMAVAPEAQPEPIVVPEGDEAVKVLTELAEQNRRVQTARKRYDDAQATAKARKSTWESESERLSSMLTAATTKPAMPLFDAAQSEADLQRMEQAIDAGRTDAGEAQDETSAGEPTSESPGVPIEAPTASPAVSEEPVPF